MNKKILNFIKKKNKSKIISLTAYSKNIASIIDKHCDLILVGDSLGFVLYNFLSTKKVTLDMMIEHSKSVRMGVKKSLMVVDMPHNTYQNSKEALSNAKKIISKTIENTPASSKSLESFKILFLSVIFFPLNLKFVADCGRIPRCPITGILFLIKVLII